MFVLYHDLELFTMQFRTKSRKKSVFASVWGGVSILKKCENERKKNIEEVSKEKSHHVSKGESERE